MIEFIIALIIMFGSLGIYFLIGLLFASYVYVKNIQTNYNFEDNVAVWIIAIPSLLADKYLFPFLDKLRHDNSNKIK